jgi:hypothetical protein
MKTKETSCVLYVKEDRKKRNPWAGDRKKSQDFTHFASQWWFVRWQFRLLYGSFCLSGCQESWTKLWRSCRRLLTLQYILILTNIALRLHLSCRKWYNASYYFVNTQHAALFQTPCFRSYFSPPFGAERYLLCTWEGTGNVSLHRLV